MSEQIQVGHKVKSSVPVTVYHFYDEMNSTDRLITYREEIATGVTTFTIPDTGLYALYDETLGEMHCLRGVEKIPAPQTQVSELYDYWQLALSQPVSDILSGELQCQTYP